MPERTQGPNSSRASLQVRTGVFGKMTDLEKGEKVKVTVVKRLQGRRGQSVCRHPRFCPRFVRIVDGLVQGGRGGKTTELDLRNFCDDMSEPRFSPSALGSVRACVGVCVFVGPFSEVCPSRRIVTNGLLDFRHRCHRATFTCESSN